LGGAGASLYCRVLQWSLGFLKQVWAIHTGTQGGATVRSGKGVEGTGERSDESIALMTGYFLQMECGLSEVRQRMEPSRGKEDEERKILSHGASFELRCLRQYLAGKAIDQEAPELHKLGEYLVRKTIHQEAREVHLLKESLANKTFDREKECIVLRVLLRAVQKAITTKEEMVKKIQAGKSLVRGDVWFLWNKEKRLHSARNDLLLLKRSEIFFEEEMAKREFMLKRKGAAGKSGDAKVQASASDEKLQPSKKVQEVIEKARMHIKELERKQDDHWKELQSLQANTVNVDDVCNSKMQHATKSANLLTIAIEKEKANLERYIKDNDSVLNAGKGKPSTRPQRRPQSARGADHASLSLGKQVTRRNSWRS
jgi:hypothetical protein